MFLSCERKDPKELCALWRVLFSFARCPASRQLGIDKQIKSLAGKKQCLKQTFQRLQLAAHTTNFDHNVRSNPCILLITAEFHYHCIDWL
jgi:hypothetical protein